MYFCLSYDSAVLNRQAVLFSAVPLATTLCYSTAHETQCDETSSPYVNTAYLMFGIRHIARLLFITAQLTDNCHVF